MLGSDVGRLVGRRASLSGLFAGWLTFGCPGGEPDASSGPDLGWSSFGGDLAHTRSVAGEVAITPESVGELVRKWSVEAGLSAVTSTPAVVDGVVYFGAWNGKLYAVDAEGGQVLWESTLQGPTGLARTSMLSGSPAVTSERVFIGGDGSQVFAVDRASGAKLWTAQADDTDLDSTRIWSSPVVHDDTLVIGNGSYEVFVADNQAAPVFGAGGTFTFRGSVVGLDAASGALRWKTYLTDPGVFGVSVWSSAAIDETLGVAFIGTGQGYTAPASPLSDALVALRLTDGEILWSRQFTPDDLWSIGGTKVHDWDVGAAPNLFETQDGRALVGVGDKAGSYYAIDRESGELVWMRTLTPGSHLGGVMGPAAYANGTIFVASNLGLAGGTSDAYPIGATLFALDAENGNARWTAELLPGVIGGVTEVNGVVFVVTTDGVLRAHSAADGLELWRDDLGSPAAGGVSVADGKVFVGFGWAWTSTPKGGLVAYGLP